MKINKNNIRVARRTYNVYGKYWHNVEVNINDTWMVPYFINKDLKKTHYILSSFNPKDRDNIVNWCLKKIDEINNLIESGYELVDYKTYKEYYEQLREEELGDKYIYIK